MRDRLTRRRGAAAPVLAPRRTDDPLALAGEIRDQQVLVVGAGTGESAARFLEAGAAAVLACDPAPEGATRGEVDLRRIGWQALDPHRHGLFHLVHCRRPPTREPDPLGLLLRLRQLSFEGGRLILEALTTPADGWWDFGPARLSELLATAGWAVDDAVQLTPGRVLLGARTVAISPDLLAAQHQPTEANNRFPVGHYYSPMPDHTELAQEPRRSQVWPAVARETPAIDWRDDAQIRLCSEVFAGQERLSFAAAEPADPTEYFTDNNQYPALDAWLLEGLLTHLRPRRMIEVGSGFSSLVSARVNRERLDGTMRFTCIEPYPRQFLLDGVPGISDLRVEKIQDTPPEVFEELGDGDVLFIDTSHTVKTGGDVTWIFEEILPRLAPGVVVHIHDVFLPGDYPEPWVREGWGWNEVYLVHAFLAFNAAFELVVGAQYMAQKHLDVLYAAFPGLPAHINSGGGALWLRRRSVS